MEVRNVNKSDLYEALRKTNEIFDGNVEWNRMPEYMGDTRQGKPKYRLTLRVRDSSGPGARRGHTGRRMVSLCWHGHGEFMDNLPEDAEIIVQTNKGRQVKRPGDPWEDYNIGSQWRPLYYSEACECGL